MVYTHVTRREKNSIYRYEYKHNNGSEWIQYRTKSTTRTVETKIANDNTRKATDIEKQ
jgi:hypothetical protein